MRPTLRSGLRLAALPALSLLSAGVLAAQATADAPPPVLQVLIETVRGGRGSSHAALEQRWAETFRRAGVPVYWLGATTVTGPSEAWYFTGLSGIGDIEALDKAVEGSPGLESASDLLAQADVENVSQTRSFLARYREDLSHGTNAAATARYFELLTFRVRPGHDNDFEQAAKLYRTVMTEAKGSGHWATYQVVSGMPGPTYLVFVPLKSLGELDPGADMAAIQKAMTAERQKTFSQLSSAGFISETSIVLRFAPGMSYLPKEFTDLDPGFWNVKP